MIDILLHSLRRQLDTRGGEVASGLAERFVARSEEPRIVAAELIEEPLDLIEVPSNTGWDAPVGFLDGVQQTELVGYHGTEPLLLARIAAGVRIRSDRRLQAAVRLTRNLLVGSMRAIDRHGSLPATVDAVAVDDDGIGHPLAGIERARAAIDAARAALELVVGSRFRDEHPEAWLIVDGPLTVSPDWAADTRMIGVVKSHTTLPFEGDDLERYLRLPYRHRSSLFRMRSRAVAPVASFGLRLAERRGHDLLHGLVRVELPLSEATTVRANAVAARILAERLPIAADGRNDRLLYGVHDVERWLRVPA